ncbi:O-antigen acetylase [Nitrospirillum viridazoti Y2]|uniref:acyltransferase family protein n=1 Tax=Nitrospirillum viridazoti TaxID=3144925 RepID=UPI00022655AE|nr:acyltransferase family protein [Nitrospirillum amazonense]EGY02754.1 O-antigen acetylase [Nitrospirillum amazonense Y2]
MNQENHHIGFRPYVQGLRAIAIIAVVLFHFGATNLSGGFVGVDIFFVISGFLISLSINNDIINNNFSIISFYRKRVIRIIPASIFTIFMTSIISYNILGPSQLHDFGKSAIFSLIYVPNIYLYTASGYFAPAATDIPLLHYWSLGVEEQFYLLYPAIVLISARFFPKRVPAVLLLLFLLSFIGELIIRNHNPDAAFYLLPFRAFELLIGCILATVVNKVTLAPKMVAPISYTGLLMIILSMVLIDEAMSFPGVVALIPCLGTALVIWGGENGKTALSRFIGSGPFKFIGNISYSLYLVHWPFLVVWRHLAPGADSAIYIAASLIMCTFLAWLSYQFIEQPFIRKRVRGRLAPALIVGAALPVLAFGGLVIANQGYPSRFNDSAREVMAGKDTLDAFLKGIRKGTCFIDIDNQVSDFNEKSCLGQKPSDPVLWGDSTLAHLYHGLAPRAQEYGVTLGQLTSSGCPPILDLVVPKRPNCLEFNHLAFQMILSHKPQRVILGGAWVESMLPELDKTILRLKEAGVSVTVLGPPEMFLRPVPTILTERRQKGDRSIFPGNDLNKSVSKDLDSLLAQHFRGSDVRYISTPGVVCGGAEKCIMALGDTPVYLDFVHLTTTGSLYYGQRLAPDLFSETGGFLAGHTLHTP